MILDEQMVIENFKNNDRVDDTLSTLEKTKEASTISTNTDIKEAMATAIMSNTVTAEETIPTTVNDDVPVTNEEQPTEVIEEPTEMNLGLTFSTTEVDFSKDDTGLDVEKVINEVKEKDKSLRDEEKYIYKSYSDQKISPRANNPKLSFLDNISVDLQDVTITKKSPIDQVQDINTIFNNNVATFTVTCCQSGYWASMSGLTLAEKNAINNSDGGSIFQFRKKLYQTVYNKIQSMSIPKPNFNDW